MSVAGDAVKDNKKILLLSFGLLAVAILGLILTDKGITMPEENLVQNNNTLKTYSQPEQVLEEDIDYGAVIKTSMGDIEIDLFENETPITVNSFLFLTKEKFYNGLTFHRIVKDFVIQGGDPDGIGTGGPGYQIPDEITDRGYKAYTLGMANAGPDTNGSQFFITTGQISPQSIEALNGSYTIFGEVTKGFAVVDSIERVETDATDKPVNPVVIESIQIIEN
ncbi:MAG TPA: peptidylprolyl isomerase [Candidatus Dojkabacteria bacterium]|nr:peptidylprolyl isomerase [Candidatus Dojkabacteria bacterium]